jgi:hypothetical protein
MLCLWGSTTAAAIIGPAMLPTPTSWAPGLRCPRCKRRHRSWYAVACCRWERGLCWVNGDPPADGPCFACVSFCRGVHYGSEFITATLWSRLSEAEEAKHIIDVSACGGACNRQHVIFTMRSAAADK